METMTSHQIKGLPVMNIAEGEKVGAISRVYVDPARKMVVGFGVDPSRSWNELDRTYLLDADKVHSIGPDAVTIDDETVIGGAKIEAEMADLIDLHDLVGRKAVTDAGEVIGQIAAAGFNLQGYDLAFFEISPGLLKSNSTIPIERVMTVGADFIVVGAESETADSDESSASTEASGSHVIIDDQRGKETADA